MKKIKVEVTEEDIKKGIPYFGTCCPIALACYRLFKISCFVTRHSIYSPREAKTIADLPSEVIVFIEKFDKSHPLERPKPITFEIEVEERYLK